MLAIVTGTIKPDNRIAQLKLYDMQERLKQYIDSLLFLVDTEAFSKIVFCDNSNSELPEFEHLRQEAEKRNIELEILVFSGSSKQIIFHGKGYGEGEIMKYVFEHSKLIDGEKSFIKITGRMKVVNIKDIAFAIRKNKTYFNVPSRTLRTLYDTRIYAMPVDEFKKYFIRRYEEVRDDQGNYLEHVYTKVIKENNIRVTNFPKYPRIVGISGSTGNPYVYKEWKCKVKDILSWLGYYKVRD